MLAKARSQKEQSIKAQALKKKLADKNSRKSRRKGGELIEAELLRDPEDIRLDPKYAGQTEILLKFVPLRTSDESTDVDAVTLREWVIYAIVEEDPLSQQFFDRIQRLNEVIADIESNIKKVPHISFYDENGKLKPEAQARVERERLFTKLGDELVQAETNLDETNRELKNHVEWRKKMGVHLTVIDTDKNTSTATWLLELSGTDDVQEIEDLLIQKRNWQGIKLACHYEKRDPPLPAWAGRGDVPDGKNPTLPNYTGLDVNMLGVRVMRIPAGIGFYRHLDRSSCNIASDQFGLYYGEYEHGKKHGYGIQINDSGVYTGAYENGFRSGPGRIDYGDGTTITGNFSIKRQSTLPQSLGFQNPYLDGEPNGLCEVYYPDGGYFRGHFVNGEITGQGEYQSAFNEMMSGNFQNSLLHGKNCFHQTSAEDVHVGHFQHGELNGFGTQYNNSNGSSYDGYWQANLKHGRGITTMPGVGRYRGYYINGIKHGKGSLEYGEKKRHHHNHAKHREDEEDENSEENNDQETGEDPDTKKSTRSRGKQKKKNDESSEDENHDAMIDKLKSFEKKMKKLSSHKRKTDKNAEEEIDEEERERLEREKEQKERQALQNKENHDHVFEFSLFENIYQGFFLGGNIANQGSIMHTVKQKPTILSRLDRNKIYPIQQVLAHEYRLIKTSNHFLEKYSDLENFIRKDIQGKKLKIYKQQKHFSKKMIYQEDVYNKFDFSQLENKLTIRTERLNKFKNIKEDSDLYFYKNAKIPRLKNFNYQLFTNYTQGMERIQPDNRTMKMDDYINHDLLRTVFSDFEEVRERQRFLKYDLIWQRAEEAYDTANRA
jgi:hypothetical protein